MSSEMIETLEKFYSAFSKLDPETMASCYHEDVVFTDPAFGELHGEQVKNMWRMLCANQKGKDFIVTYSNAEASEKSGQINWEAQYDFSLTKRRVHNKIKANFEFQEGLIIQHTDHFNLYNCSKQAFGTFGYLFGWTKAFKRNFQTKARKTLEDFEMKSNA